jgi:hypothetical protein
MPLFQYFGWVGSFLLAALLAANWWFPAPIGPTPTSDVPLNRSINIRIHTDLNAWCLTPRVRRWRLKRKSTLRLTLGQARLSLRQSACHSKRSPKWRPLLSGRVFRPPCSAGQAAGGDFAHCERRHLKIARARR